MTNQKATHPAKPIDAKCKPWQCNRWVQHDTVSTVSWMWMRLDLHKKCAFLQCFPNSWESPWTICLFSIFVNTTNQKWHMQPNLITQNATAEISTDDCNMTLFQLCNECGQGWTQSVPKVLFFVCQLFSSWSMNSRMSSKLMPFLTNSKVPKTLKMWACMHLHSWTCPLIHMHVHTHACTCKHANVQCTHAHAHTHACACTRTHTQHLHLWICGLPANVYRFTLMFRVPAIGNYNSYESPATGSPDNVYWFLLPGTNHQ